MPLRSVALYKGKYIGIETIYTVHNGLQINDPERLKEVRGYSQRNELFCPCGCETNYILVAGDKNVREQHFREKAGTRKRTCTFVEEGETSINSRIVLKVWLAEKLKADDLQERVPISVVEESARRVEFTFLSKDKKLGIRYWNTRANIIDDKLDVIHTNLSGIRVVYIVDQSNGSTGGQYQEILMRLQERQGYCLLLGIDGCEYPKAQLCAVVYERDADGCWQELRVASAYLKDVDIEGNELLFQKKPINDLVIREKNRFVLEQKAIIDRRHAEEEQRKEQFRIWQAEQDRKEAERRYRLAEEREKSIREAAERAERERIAKEESARRLAESEAKRKSEQENKWSFFNQNLGENILQQEEQVKDPDGELWFLCYFCKKTLGKRDLFIDILGPYGTNRGKCKACGMHFLRPLDYKKR